MDSSPQLTHQSDKHCIKDGESHYSQREPGQKGHQWRGPPDFHYADVDQQEEENRPALVLLIARNKRHALFVQTLDYFVKHLSMTNY